MKDWAQMYTTSEDEDRLRALLDWTKDTGDVDAAIDAAQGKPGDEIAAYLTRKGFTIPGRCSSCGQPLGSFGLCDVCDDSER